MDQVKNAGPKDRALVCPFLRSRLFMEKGAVLLEAVQVKSV
jgi:hypothetical protein